MATAVPAQNALLMGGYGVGQKYAESYSSSQPRSSKYAPIFVGGCVGGFMQSFLMSPVELVKVSQQCPDGSGSLRQLKAVFLPSNVSRGLGATLLRDVIPHGVWFAAYEFSKDILKDHYSKDPILVPLVSGAVAATVAWGIGYPGMYFTIENNPSLSSHSPRSHTYLADIIKTRIQTGNPGDGILQTANILIRENQGGVIRALYKGFTLKLVRAIPSSMISFTVYEFVKRQIS